MCHTSAPRCYGRHLSHMSVQLLIPGSISIMGTLGTGEGVKDGKREDSRFFSVSEELHSRLPSHLYSQVFLQLVLSPPSGVCPKLSLLHKASLSL